MAANSGLLHGAVASSGNCIVLSRSSAIAPVPVSKITTFATGAVGKVTGVGSNEPVSLGLVRPKTFGTVPKAEDAIYGYGVSLCTKMRAARCKVGYTALSSP